MILLQYHHEDNVTTATIVVTTDTIDATIVAITTIAAGTGTIVVTTDTTDAIGAISIVTIGVIPDVVIINISFLYLISYS
ncbi:hypothetical protein TI03_00925 [Achromatium sp. WMS1]|nr:hypothetical protein TI03_00925 [Achromatium sp. WMS1]